MNYAAGLFTRSVNLPIIILLLRSGSSESVELGRQLTVWFHRMKRLLTVFHLPTELPSRSFLLGSIVTTRAGHRSNSTNPKTHYTLLPEGRRDERPNQS
jgi:hypothetical protein